MKTSQLEDMWRHIQKIEFEAHVLKPILPSNAKVILREVSKLKAQIQLLMTANNNNQGDK